jgi:hypothetical protein
LGGGKLNWVGRLQSISVAAALTVDLMKLPLAFKSLIIVWVVALPALMLGGRIITKVKARLSATITIRARVFLRERFLVALVIIPIFLPPDYTYYHAW